MKCSFLILLLLGLSSTVLTAAERQVLRSQVPQAVAKLHSINRLAAASRLKLAISLPLRNPEDLADFLKQVYDPASPNFRHYLTPEQFTERFGPTRENYQAVIDFVKSQGLTVTGTHSNRALVDVSGAVTDIEQAFHVHLLVYNHPFESRTFYAPDVEPSVDTAAPILEVNGLDNYVLPRPLYRSRSSNVAHTSNAKPAFGSGPSGTYIGNDFRAAYVPGVTLTGAGQKVGLFEIGGYYTNDLMQYASQAGLTNVLAITNVLVEGYGTPGPYNAEVALDIEMVMSMAPGAQIVVYESNGGIIDVLERMISDNLAKQLSCSWAIGSGLTVDLYYQQMAAQGQTFFNASGDDGAYTSQSDIPVDDPYITTVGGTTLTTDANGSWMSETAWNWAVTGEGNNATGGGGSTIVAIPSWQQGINMANNNGLATRRNLPDVAMVADNMYVVANNGQPEMLGGTSFSSPLWAAFTALVNQKAAAQSKQPVGFLNPILYAIGKSASYRTSFHDVVSGNNTNNSSPTKYFAIPGYDLCTGWGSPQTNLIDLLLNFQVPPLTNSTPRTIRVPADYATIQAAINAASALTNDTVLVSPGTYNEAVNFNGKPALLVSLNGPNVTQINPPAGSNAVTFASGETTNSIISGFTLAGGNSGIYVSGSSPKIISNNIVNCGTGIYCYSGSPVMLNNLISNSSGFAIYLYVCNSPLLSGNALVGNQGGGVSMTVGGSPTIINNLIQDNLGDAIIMSGYCNANIVQNVITGNTGDGISAEVASGARGPWVINNTISGNGGNGIGEDGYFSNCEIINNIVAGNPALYISATSGTNPPIIQFNDFYSANGNVYAGGVITNLNGIAGNISTNPFFACLSSGDFRLFTVSSCIDAGTNGAPLLPALDFNGNPRILTGNTNGSAIVDMGAYEFNPAAPPTPCLYINCPSNVVATAAVGQNSAVVTYPAPDATPTATVTCVPASGSVFPGGTNVVVCTVALGSNTLTGTFTVTVLVPPYITNQPSFISVLANSNASIIVGAFGTLPLSYQWAFAGTVIADATNSTLIVSNAQSINEGYYQVTMANSLGTATSGPILLRVLPSKALIVSGPQSISVPAGTQAEFNANVVGSAPLTLQWYKNGALLAGAVSSQLIIPNAQAADAGTYQLLASNSLGTAISPGAILTVLPAKPSFILQPVSTAGLPGASVAFESLAIGSDDDLNPIRYAWYFQSNQIPGQTSANLSLASIVAANQGAYYVVASNFYGSATSAVVQLTVYQAPSLTNGLSNQVVDEGSNLVLNSGAVGTPPLAYSWSFNTIALSNTTAFLSLANIMPLQAGYYSVTVTNQFGSISGTGKISVFLPASQVVAWGDDSGGQTDVPTNLDDAVAVAGGDYHSVAIRHDGTLVAWGIDDEGQIDVPTNSLEFVSIAAGADHNLAVAEDGSVVAWGRDDSGQTDIPGTVSSVLSVAAGDSHSLALLASGLVVAWGDNTYGQTSLPNQLIPGYYVGPWWYPIWVNNPNWMPVQAIAAGRNHNLAVLTNGTVVAWGDNSFGQSSPPPNLSNVVAVTAGYLHSVALCSNGTVVAWGDNTFGQTNVSLGLSNVVAIAAGDFDTLALLSNGNIIGWGDDTFGQLGVPSGAANVVGIASGYYHGLALVPFIQVLQAHLRNGLVVINWNGTGILQWAPTPVGPYADVLSQGNSWTNLNMSAPAKFFRVRR